MRALQVCLSYMPAHFIAVVLIFENYILSVLEATLYARRSEKIGFGLLIHEVSKISLAIPLLYILRIGLIGALAALIFAYLCQILFYLYNITVK
ncbi:MAG: hypothetical protein QXW39_04610 [Candidatus Bathyarchaeia archaeon]